MVQCFEVASEVRTKKLEGNFWAFSVDSFNAGFVVVGSAIAQIISIDDGDYSMPEVHRSHCFCEVVRFLWVEGWWAFDGPHGTKAASTGAFLSSDHERCISAGPTIVNVGASSLFTNSVQFVVFHGGFCSIECRLLLACG
jgi:hypothetical protein